MSETKRLVPMWIVYVDGLRLDSIYEGALKRVVVDDILDGVGMAVLEFGGSAVRIRESGVFSLESTISVHLGYKDDCSQVFYGEITEFRVDYKEGGGEQINVICKNCLHKLEHAYRSLAFEKKRLSDAVRERIGIYGLKAEVEEFGAVKPFFAELQITDYDFVMESAKAYGKTVYAYEDKIYVKDEITVSEDEVILEWGKSLIAFKCEERLDGQVTGCKVTAWDMDRCRGVTGDAKIGDVRLKIGNGKFWNDMSKGGGERWETVLSEESPADEEDAKALAVGYIQNVCMKYQRGKAKTEGNQRARSGMRVEIKNEGGYYSGEYIAERVVHEICVCGGFTTEIYVRRNMNG